MNDSAGTAHKEHTAQVGYCLGALGKELFQDTSSIPGRPSFPEFSTSPHLWHLDLPELGLDSLSWMEALTALEGSLHIEFPDVFLSSGKLTPYAIAQQAASLLASSANTSIAFEAMTCQTRSDSCYEIIDDFLPEAMLVALRQASSNAEFLPIRSVVDEDADGPAFRSKGQVIGLKKNEIARNSLDPYERILAALGETQQIFGQLGEDWTQASFAFWQYPAGSRLGWHNDAGRDRIGEFILYIHEKWEPSWGGELLLQSTNTHSPGEVSDCENPFEYVARSVAENTNELVAIPPRPNRLVMLKAGTPHCINRVDATAGDYRRCSLTGFASRTVRTLSNRQDRMDALGAMAGWHSPEVESTSQSTLVEQSEI